VGQASLLNHADTSTVRQYEHELADEGRHARLAVHDKLEALKAAASS